MEIMTIYTNAKQLEGKTLEWGDRVKFTFNDGIELTYEVSHTFLNNVDRCDNSLVFRKLGMTTNKEKYAFASKIYGYETDTGMWPETEEDDFEALTKLVIALYELIDGVPITREKVCYCCKKQQEPIQEFRTTDGVGLCADCYKKISFYYRKGLFSLKEVKTVKNLFHSEKRKRESVLTTIYRKGKKDDIKPRELFRRINTGLKKWSEIKYKMPVDDLDPEQVTEVFEMVGGDFEIFTPYRNEELKRVSLEDNPYLKFAGSYFKDISFTNEYEGRSITSVRVSN